MCNLEKQLSKFVRVLTGIGPPVALENIYRVLYKFSNGFLAQAEQTSSRRALGDVAAWGAS